MTVYEAFCGIGGFSLGFRRAGFEIIGGCEIDPYARAVYRKNFGIEPDGDIRTVDHVSADIICGGFPCQPFSVAGLQRGTKDERDLWPELARIIRASRPKFVVLENVPALLSIERGAVFGRILRDLAESGFDAEWDCLPASAFGAPHERDRIFLVANSKGFGMGERGTQRSRNAAPLPMPSSDCGRSSTETWPVAWTEVSADICRMGDGLPNRAHRGRCLGNAIVPQIAEWIAERIKEVEMTFGEPTKQEEGK